MENNKLNVWISKYALTQGIFEVEASRCLETNNPDMIRTEKCGFFHGESKDWHLTKEDAIKKAEEMRLKKIELLKKQIIKLEKLDFNKATEL